jgi:NADH:ubiquinone reductase (H+-translocating)
MNKVIIIGGGFGGLAALRKLSWYRVGAEITLIEKKKTSDFLPELPSVLGRGVLPRHLTCDVRRIVTGYGARFIQGEVTLVDNDNMEIHCAGERLKYDYLIIASGSETNFYGADFVKKYAYKLDDAEDAVKIREVIERGSFNNVIVAGGGYTGIEVATNIKVFCDKRKLNKKICIVERAKSILGPLPQSLKEYTVLNLLKMGIKICLETTVTNVERDKVTLSTGDVFEDSILIWAAGVKTGEVIDKLKLATGNQGRVKVDEYLKADNRIFVIGDAAEFMYKEKPLRMAVQFAIFQGRHAAENIANSIRGLPLKKFVPVDLGYIVPMANNRSCGIVLGKYVSGVPATFFHYAMCIYRLRTIKNKIGLLRDVLFGSRG